MNRPHETKRSQNVNGFPVTIVLEARLLGEGGWQPTEIVRLFAKRGVNPLPTPSAVRWWLRGALDFESQMELQRRSRARSAAERSGGRLLSKPRSPEFRLTRVRALRAIGLSCAAVAKVMNFDLGDDWTENDVRYVDANGRLPKRLSQRVAA